MLTDTQQRARQPMSTLLQGTSLLRVWMRALCQMPHRSLTWELTNYQPIGISHVSFGGVSRVSQTVALRVPVNFANVCEGDCCGFDAAAPCKRHIVFKPADGMSDLTRASARKSQGVSHFTLPHVSSSRCRLAPRLHSHRTCMS